MTKRQINKMKEIVENNDSIFDEYGLKNKEIGYDECLIWYYNDRIKKFKTFKDWTNFDRFCYELSIIFEIDSHKVRGILISKYSDIFVISTNYGLNHIELK